MSPGSVKEAFSTRRVSPGDMAMLLDKHVTPAPGDLVLARVDRIGQHTRIQLRGGRRSALFVGDYLIVAYGNRYATDQFEALVPDDLGPCHLVAAGGIAGRIVRSRDGVRAPTRLTPLGLVADGAAEPLNLSRYGLPLSPLDRGRAIVIAVVGTAMNSGKTTAAAHCIRGLSRLGHRVAGIKVTGTGSGNDVWMYEDAGADLSLDFTDAGYASTHRLALPRVEEITATLVGHAARSGVDVAVIEIADGLYQAETAALLSSAVFRQLYDGLIVCAGDAMGAQSSVEWLEQRGHAVNCVSGALTASPMALEEAERVTRLPVAGRAALADPDAVLRLLDCVTDKR
jgi:hypothetical protein